MGAMALLDPFGAATVPLKRSGAPDAVLGTISGASQGQSPTETENYVPA